MGDHAEAKLASMLTFGGGAYTERGDEIGAQDLSSRETRRPYADPGSCMNLPAFAACGA